MCNIGDATLDNFYEYGTKYCLTKWLLGPITAHLELGGWTPCLLIEHLASRAYVRQVSKVFRSKTLNRVSRLLFNLKVDTSHLRLLSRHMQSTYHVIMQHKAMKENFKNSFKTYLALVKKWV
jgi:hypothetical protein